MERGLKVVLVAITATLLGLLIHQPALCQESHQRSRKFDEYSKCKQANPDCINLESEWARLDSFAVNLRDDLKVQGYIIGYKTLQSLPGSSLRHINYVRNLVRRRIVDDSRIHIIDGGYRERLTIELWLVPDGTSAPSPSHSVAAKIPDNKSAYKFDEFSPRLRKEIPREFLEDELVWYDPSVLMDGFAALLEREPSLRGSIVAYDGLKDRTGIAYSFAETYREYLYSSATIGNPVNTITSSKSRIISVKGGRRKERTIELWIVPPNAAIPKSASVSQSRKRKP